MQVKRTETESYIGPNIFFNDLNVIMWCDTILLYVDPGLYIKISLDPQ